MKYEAQQLQRIRNTLEAFLDLGLSDGGSASGTAYTWKSLAEAISDVTGVRIPTERLRKFVKGEPHRDKVRKQMGDRYYPSLSPERLKAVVMFLTQEDSDGYSFPLEDLQINPDGLSAVHRLAEHLNGNRHTQRLSDASGLAGCFIADQITADISATVTLHFSKRHHKGLVPLSLSKKYQRKKQAFKGTKVSEPELELEQSTNDICIDRYRGWAVLTPEESMLLLAKKIDTDENMMYTALGIDKALYLQKSANAMALLEIEQPEDGILIQIDDGTDNTQDLLANVKENFLQQILLFRRQANDAV